MTPEKKHRNHIKRYIAAGAIVVALGLQSAAGIMPGTDAVKQAKAARASYQEDEYTSELSDYIEAEMNMQLRAYFSGSNGKKAKMTKSTDPDYKTKITFYLDPAKMGDVDVDKMLGYLYELIASNPNFCTMSTSIIWNRYTGEFSVHSVVAKKKQAAAINKFKSFLADVERVPMQAEDMSDIEILLYLHDTMIQQANYAKNMSDKSIYVPYFMSTTGKVVCQSYAAVLNNLMRDLGFTCYILTSENHEWNVVKLDGKWTCIDATWDDPSGNELDYVLHENFLVKLSSFKTLHSVEDFINYRYKKITSKAENAFTTLPKSDKLCHPVCYKSGIWFYADGGILYRWDGVSKKADIEEAVPEDYMRCVAVLDGVVYIGGTDGIFTYDPESHVMENIKSNVECSGLYYFGKTLYYNEYGTWNVCAVASTPYADYEELNGTENTIKVDLAVPTKPTVKVVKSSAKSIRVTVTKRSVGATGSYQIQYSTDPDFSYNNRKKTIRGLTASLTGLTKGVKYYVRVRGINKQDEYLMKYGTWSKVKSV